MSSVAKKKTREGKWKGICHVWKKGGG